MSNRLTYHVELRAQPGITDDETQRGLRGFLKAALRQWGFRCTLVEQITDDATNALTTDTTTTEADQ